MKILLNEVWCIGSARKNLVGAGIERGFVRFGLVGVAMECSIRPSIETLPNGAWLAFVKALKK